MKFLLSIAALFLSLTSIAQEITFEQWQEEAKENIRLLPEYGHMPKNEGQKEADSIFIKESLEQDGTPRKASDHLVSLGFQYLNKGNIKTAMYRFNQAWLIDSTNENAWWGFGAIYFTFHDMERAEAMFDKGLSMNPKSSVILTDKATIYTVRLDDSFNKTDFEKARALFEQSYAIDPENQNTLFKLSALHYRNNDCKSALRYYEENMKLGGKQITKTYIDALKEKCK